MHTPCIHTIVIHTHIYIYIYIQCIHIIITYYNCEINLYLYMFMDLYIYILIHVYYIYIFIYLFTFTYHNNMYLKQVAGSTTNQKLTRGFSTLRRPSRSTSPGRRLIQPLRKKRPDAELSALTGTRWCPPPSLDSSGIPPCRYDWLLLPNIFCYNYNPIVQMDTKLKLCGQATIFISCYIHKSYLTYTKIPNLVKWVGPTLQEGSMYPTHCHAVRRVR